MLLLDVDGQAGVIGVGLAEGLGDEEGAFGVFQGEEEFLELHKVRLCVLLF